MEPPRKKRKSAVKAMERINNMSLGELVGHVPETNNRLGYFVLRTAIEISPEEYSDLVAYSKPKNSPIFNYSATRKSDGKRLQSNIPRKNPVFKRILSLCKSVLPKTLPNNPVIITSFAGCQEQAPHCDWNVFDFSGDDCDGCPYGFLLCIDETCELVVWESSHLTVRLSQIDEERLPEKKRIYLKRGDVLIFRGDLIHAGASYETENIRLHCYLDPTGTNRGSNQTFPFKLFPCISLKEHVSKP